MDKKMARIILIALVAVLAACTSPRFSATTFPYQIDEAALKEKPIRTVVIASANVSGEPTRYHLQQPSGRVDRLVSNYLQENGFKVAPGYRFDNAWNQALRTHGELYDPTTGRVDPQTWQAVMVQTVKALAEQGDIDAVVFTDLIEHEVRHNVGLDHLAQWYGVSRKPDTASHDKSITATFDWNKPLKGASLVITIFNTDLKGVFASRGGLDTLQVIDTRDERYVRRKRLLENERYLMEGIQIAFHPFIPMKDYPAAK